MNWNTIDNCIEEKSLLKTEYYQAWSKGELTLDDLRFYAKQYYHLEVMFPRFLSSIHASCDDIAIQQKVLENLNDEQQGENNHRELWLRFAEGLGLTREEVISAPCDPATQKCIDTLMELAKDPNPVVGLSAMYAYESQLPDISVSKIEGLKNFYGIDAQRALEFFHVHHKVDAWHAEQERDMITAMNPDMNLVSAAVEKSCDALCGFLDGVDGATRLARNPQAECCH